MVKGSGGKESGGGHGVRRTSFKRARRARFRVRGDDQIRKDLEKGKGERETVDGRLVGPVGTINKVVLDDDIPGCGKFFCAVCARYFANEESLRSHNKTKKHKRRHKLFYDRKTGELRSEEDIHHSQDVADRAKGRGRTDNGQRLGRGGAATMATETLSAAAAGGNQDEPVDFGEL
ncbi:hypothetical protein HOP50_16g78840 [Chloropicon primus]|uniref:C2H2-type domain-containing protein n=1 Tax=Chloropicon primus TaxID=1764295 RepID=A0A5B8MZ49_9CHLO|nr:hypothetical protein A3770_16p78540 [Chloropicon primus]UPR04542.1 hypothetical protein HOP50_16g78840 [Chloropicon primus]|mmetsp:Transcript_96/g.237  ORF Transcript_96/g.237 Transcript_96/m.237 type:complete len:176 (+) Transcript_96:403-930(+)|eukprot:QDZ25336.1 hypothetical protein A3770_16p78540 [Chloropicon primus]